MSISFVETHGGRLAVECEGDGPLVICSPGLGDFRDAYDALTSTLIDAGYRVARVDLRGHGESSTGFDRYGDEAVADDYLTLMDKLGGGPAVLIGASLSAGAAVIAAGRCPEKVAGLVLISPYLRNTFSPFVLKLSKAAFVRPWGPSVWRMYATKLWPGLGEKAGERARGSVAIMTQPGRWDAFLATYEGADHRVVTPWLDRVHAPVLVIVGDADPDWKDPAKEAQWIASNFSGARTVMVPGAGHAPMLERPDVVGPAVSQFLETIREGGAFKPSSV